MIGFYNYTVIATYVGLFSGICGIFSSLKGDPTSAIYFLMISGFCDMFDGRIARTRKRNDAEQKFGIQIDSLSDLICFGVLPATIGYGVGLNKPYFIPLLALYVLCALIRLAYFNVMEEERQATTNKSRKEYEGLPVTTVALIFPLLYGIRMYFKSYFFIAYAALMFIVAALFVLRFRVKKPRRNGMLLLIAVGIVELLLLINGVRK